MENRAVSNNMSAYNFTTENVDQLPLYLSTHAEIPSVLIHELAVIWMVIGMVFNAFLIYYLVASRKYRSPVFMLVLFLASTDFVVCLSIACLAGFVWPVYVLPKHTWILCKIVYYMLDAAASASPYYLVLFAALRFYQLCFPLKARARVTSSFVRNWCLLIMIVEVAGWSPFLFSYDVIDVNYDGTQSLACEYMGSLLRVANISFLVVNTCVPGISILVLHVIKYIGVSLRSHSLDTQQTEGKNTDIRAMMIVIVMYYIGWFPLNIYLMTHEYLPNHGIYQDRLILLLAYANGTNNTLNPVVYCFAASSIRRGIIQLICKKKVGKT